MSNKKEEQQRKTHNIRVRLDAAQYDLIQSAASSAGMSISEYIRRQAVYGKVEIHNHIVADFPKLEKLAQEFGAIGNNLNQLTRYFHMGGLKSEWHSGPECGRRYDHAGTVPSGWNQLQPLFL